MSDISTTVRKANIITTVYERVESGEKITYTIPHPIGGYTLGSLSQIAAINRRIAITTERIK